MIKFNSFQLHFIFLLVTLTVTIKRIMSASTKLSTAVKALCYLAIIHPKEITSIEIAENISVNASKLRKILSLLVKNGIVESTLGTTGGFKLKKTPDKIDLQEIYCAIEDRKAFHLDVTGVNGSEQNLSLKLNHYFLNLFSEIQVDIEEKMQHLTLQKIIDQIK